MILDEGFAKLEVKLREALKKDTTLHEIYYLFRDIGTLYRNRFCFVCDVPLEEIHVFWQDYEKDGYVNLYTEHQKGYTKVR